MTEARALRPLPAFIFASRWLQLPLYLGLIVAQVGIHLTFLVSALAIAAAHRITPAVGAPHEQKHA
jgi:uncharacterized membrane protein YqhA